MTPDYPLPILGFLGVLVSIYIIYVELHLERDAEYKPACDIERVGASCSRVFTSEAGHLLSYFGLVPRHSILDLSNGQAGLLFYLFQVIWPNLTFIPSKHRARVQFLAALGSSTVSILLGYVMVNQLHEVCVVCTFVHILNLFIFINSFRWIRLGVRKSAITQKSKSI